MPASRPSEWISPQDYLAGEQISDIKHEYVDGFVYAMVGASEPHNLIAGSLYAALRNHLRGTPCRVFMSDMKLRVDQAFYYPDLMVCCDANDRDPYFKTAPTLIIEVLSASTERNDRQEKRSAYRTLPSLREYVLVAQDKLEIEVQRRTANVWITETLTENDSVVLQSVDLSLDMAQVFEDVSFGESDSER